MARSILRVHVDPFDAGGVSESRRHGAEVPVLVFDWQVHLRWHGRFAAPKGGKCTFYRAHRQIHRADSFDLGPRQKQRFHESTLPVHDSAFWI